MYSLETISQLAKRRGFIWPSAELYGGMSGFCDWGPLGLKLKEHIKREWRRQISRREDVYEIETALITKQDILAASGHLKHFTDPMVGCVKCHHKFREDELDEKKCPDCSGALEADRPFNLMFKTHVGAKEDSSAETYLRPETAQGIFTNFKNVIDALHPKLPFGISQIGHSFRNEITPRNFLYRSREFQQAELEWFASPEEADMWFQFWREERMRWYLDLGMSPNNIRFFDYPRTELAHYSTATTDLQYRFGLSVDGFSELEGIANRTDFDLKAHTEGSGTELMGETENATKVVPYVIEPSMGVDRATLAFLMDAYTEDELGGERRVVLKLHPRLAPMTAAVFPLLKNKPQLVEKARSVYASLRESIDDIAWDDIGNIGKRYRRQDEVGTPWCMTIDFQTLEDDTVTVRERDTGEQIRVGISQLETYIRKGLGV